MPAAEVVDPKHVRTFDALVQVVDLGRAEEAWRDHRHADDPAVLGEAVQVVRERLKSHGNLLMTAVYETDTRVACPKCVDENGFQVAAKSRVMEILGYC